MGRIATSLALVGAIMLALLAAPAAGAAVPIATTPPAATATISGDTIVIVTLSEPIASFPAQAASDRSVVNGGHTIPVLAAAVDPSTPTQLEITIAAAVGRTASTLTSTVTYSGGGAATTADGDTLGAFTATLDTSTSPAIYMGTKSDSQIRRTRSRTIRVRS
jgi:hypothetical protein